MPWHTAKSANCPAGKPWAVIKDADGSVVACHESKAMAQKQVAALYASEPISAAMSENQSGDVVRFQSASDQLFTLRENEGDPVMPTLVGHFAVFDSWTEISSRYEGNFLERISPGAFKKTFSENRRNMRVLFNHGKDPMVAEKVLGPIRELREEEQGAYYEVPLYDTNYNRDLLPGLADNQYGSSFRFRVLKEDWIRSPEASEHNPDRLPERTISEAKVMEFGPVTFPAYEGATAGLRSATDWWYEHTLLGQLERLAGSGAAALEEPTSRGEPPERVTPQSRRTRVDHLATGREEKPWRL